MAETSEKDRIIQELQKENTKLRKVNEDLQQCEEKYISIFNQNRDGIVLIDVETGLMVDCNQRFEEQTGRELKQLKKMKIWEVRPPEKVETARQKFYEILARGYGTSNELDYQKPNGQITPIEFWAKRIKIGNKQYILSITKSLSELKKLKDELDFEKNKYRFFFDEAADGLAILDISKMPEEARYLDVNRRMTELLGYTKKEFLEINPFKLLAQQNNKELTNLAARVVTERTERTKISYEYQGKDDQRIPLEVDIHNLWNKGICLSVYRDISERVKYQKNLMKLNERLNSTNKKLEEEVDEHKLTEENLRKSEKRYRSIFEESRNGIALIDCDNGKIVDCNPEFERQTGRKLKELKKMHIWELRPPEIIESARAKFNEIIEKGVGGSSELEFQKPNGKRVYVDFVSKKQKIGGKCYSQSITRDITHKVLADMKIRQALENEKQLRGRLQSEIERRIQFTRLLVHELKTPLTPILATSELITHIAPDEPMASYAKNILKGASRLDRRIDELLDLTKGEMGTLKLNYSNLEAVHTIKEICNFIAPEFERKKQSFVFTLPDEAIYIRADEERFTQILVNILDNTRKYTPEQGRIKLKARKVQGNLLVEINDTGYGMSKERQELLFQPYVSPTVKDKRNTGLGLGLVLCKMLIELHNGSITVNSRVGRGTTFKVSIPTLK